MTGRIKRDCVHTCTHMNVLGGGRVQNEVRGEKADKRDKDRGDRMEEMKSLHSIFLSLLFSQFDLSNVPQAKLSDFQNTFRPLIVPVGPLIWEERKGELVA